MRKPNRQLNGPDTSINTYILLFIRYENLPFLMAAQMYDRNRIIQIHSQYNYFYMEGPI